MTSTLNLKSFGSFLLNNGPFIVGLAAFGSVAAYYLPMVAFLVGAALVAVVSPFVVAIAFSLRADEYPTFTRGIVYSMLTWTLYNAFGVAHAGENIVLIDIDFIMTVFLGCMTLATAAISFVVTKRNAKRV